MDLKCKKLDCGNNNKYSCTCNEIKVGKNCDCESYCKNEDLNQEQLQDVSKTMFEVAPDIHPYRHKNSVDICCDAKCLFNEQSKCRANGICVSGGCENASCLTFIND